MSVKLKDFMKDVDIPFTYREWPGNHEFYLWNKSLHLACEHFFTRVDRKIIAISFNIAYRFRWLCANLLC